MFAIEFHGAGTGCRIHLDMSRIQIDLQRGGVGQFFGALHMRNQFPLAVVIGVCTHNFHRTPLRIREPARQPLFAKFAAQRFVNVN